MANRGQHEVGNDEVDLTILFFSLWKQKILIILCVIFFLGAAGIYAWTATPIYQTNFLIQPPTQNDVANLNYGRGGDTKLPELTVKDVYDVYRKHLQSGALRRELFMELYSQPAEGQLGGSNNSVFDHFNRSIVVSLTAKDDLSRFTVTATSADPKTAVDWVTGFALRARDKAKAEVLENLKSDAKVKADNLQVEIENLKITSRKIRQDQIVRLKEALVIAKSIGLEQPPMVSGKLSEEISSEMGGALTYMRGSKALEAEIANLENRKTDDPFIPELREKQESLSFYRSLKIDPSHFSVFRQDGVVVVPDQPIKPRKMLILLLGLLLGIVSGLSIALTRFVLKRTST